MGFKSCQNDLHPNKILKDSIIRIYKLGPLARKYNPFFDVLTNEIVILFIHSFSSTKKPFFWPGKIHQNILFTEENNEFRIFRIANICFNVGW